MGESTCLFALRTVLRVAICSPLVLRSDLSLSTSSRRLSASRSDSSLLLKPEYGPAPL